MLYYVQHLLTHLRNGVISCFVGCYSTYDSANCDLQHLNWRHRLVFKITHEPANGGALRSALPSAVTARSPF